MTMDDFYAEQDYLEHYGIKGMKWGIRRTPEQLGHYIEKQRKKMSANVRKAQEAKRSGDVKALKKLNAKTSKYIANIEKAKKMLPDREKEYSQYQREQEAARQKKAADKAIKEQRKADKAEAKRQEFLNTADSEELYKHRHEYSADEISRAIRRIQTEQSLANLNSDANMESMRRTRERIDKMAAIGESAVSAFSTYKKIAGAVNAVTGEDTLPEFDKSKAKEREEKKKREASKKRVDAYVKDLDIGKILDERDKLSTDEFIDALTKVSSTLNTVGQAKQNKLNIRKQDTAQKLIDATENYYKTDKEIKTAEVSKSKAEAEKAEIKAKYATDKARAERDLADLASRAHDVSRNLSRVEDEMQSLNSELYKMRQSTDPSKNVLSREYDRKLQQLEEARNERERLIQSHNSLSSFIVGQSESIRALDNSYSTSISSIDARIASAGENEAKAIAEKASTSVSYSELTNILKEYSKISGGGGGGGSKKKK